MNILIPGHRYELDLLDSDDNKQILQFVDRNHGRDTPGTTNQEVIRTLIDRVKFLHAEKPHKVNDEILQHLRMALVLHEVRAIEQKVIKGKILPENIVLDSKDLHFKILVK